MTRVIRPTSRLCYLRALDFADKLVPLSGSPSNTLSQKTTLEDEGIGYLTQGPDRVSSGTDDEVAAHDNGSLESSPVDVILVDETHSASVVHFNDVGSDGENSIPTLVMCRARPLRSAKFNVLAWEMRSSRSIKL